MHALRAHGRAIRAPVLKTLYLLDRGHVLNTDPYSSPKSDLTDVAEDRPNLRLKLKTLFRILFVGYAFGLGPILMIFGIYAFFTGGESLVSLNGEKLTGTSGLVGTLVAIPIMSVIFASINWCICATGLWVYGLRRPVKLEFK